MVAHDAALRTREGPGFSEHGRTSREVRASLADKVTPTFARHNGPLTVSNPLAYHSAYQREIGPAWRLPDAIS